MRQLIQRQNGDLTKNTYNETIAQQQLVLGFYLLPTILGHTKTNQTFNTQSIAVILFRTKHVSQFLKLAFSQIVINKLCQSVSHYFHRPITQQQLL